MKASRAFIALIAAAAMPLGAGAQIVNIDNDWASFFKYDAAAAARARAPAERRMAQPGDVSADGQYVFVNDQRGWQLRPYAYAWSGGRLAHAADCPYTIAALANPPTAVAGRGVR